MSHTSPAPQHRLADLRDWLMDRIDGGEEMRGEDGLISDFIRQIDAATAELADLKQRLLPQYVGRAERAERDRDAAQVAAVAAERDARFAKHERDAMLEQLIAARSATAATAATVDHGYDRTASINVRRYVCTCGACMSATLREGSDGGR